MRICLVVSEVLREMFPEEVVRKRQRPAVVPDAELRLFAPPGDYVPNQVPLPADDAAKIAAIYDNGITFWNCVRDTAHIGDYSMNNRPGI